MNEEIGISAVEIVQPFYCSTLLEISKTGVERAIKEDEERAIDWMKQQLNALEVTLI